MKTEYEKLRTKVLGIIEGMAMLESKYFNVRQAILFAEEVHSGTRKDGSKEFSHQLEMLAFALTLHHLVLKPYEVYLSIIVHDLYEDYPQYLQEIREKFPDAEKFSLRLSKYKSGTENEYRSYFNEIADCAVCSVVKLIDRWHNLSTAPGVFSTQKLMQYCDEVDQYFFPMLKEAKRKHNQRSVYELLKNILKTQVNTIDALNPVKTAKTV